MYYLAIRNYLVVIIYKLQYSRVGCTFKFYNLNKIHYVYVFEIVLHHLQFIILKYLFIESDNFCLYNIKPKK